MGTPYSVAPRVPTPVPQLRVGARRVERPSHEAARRTWRRATCLTAGETRLSEHPLAISERPGRVIKNPEMGSPSRRSRSDADAPTPRRHAQDPINPTFARGAGAEGRISVRISEGPGREAQLAPGGRSAQPARTGRWPTTWSGPDGPGWAGRCPIRWTMTALKRASSPSRPVRRRWRSGLPDWGTVHRELRRKGVTLQLLWRSTRSATPTAISTPSGFKIPVTVADP